MYRFDEVFDLKGNIVNKKKLRIVNKRTFHRTLKAKHIVCVLLLFIVLIAFIIKLMHLGNRILQICADINFVVSLFLAIVVMLILFFLSLLIFGFFLYLINKDIEKINKKKQFEKFYGFFILDSSGKERNKSLIYSCYENVFDYSNKVKNKSQSFLNVVNLSISLIASIFILDKISFSETNPDSIEIARFIITAIVYLSIEYFEKSVEEIFENIQNIVGTDYNSLLTYYREYIDFDFSITRFKEYNIVNKSGDDNGVYSWLYFKLTSAIMYIKKIIIIKYDYLKAKIQKHKFNKLNKK